MRDLFVTLRDEHGRPARRWQMRDARIVLWTGPGAGLSGGVCAIEDIVIVAAAITGSL